METQQPHAPAPTPDAHPNDTSPTIGAIAAALAAAQVDFQAIERTRNVTVRSDKGSYSFSYAPLDVVLAAIRPALAKQGLAVTQSLTGGPRGLTVRTLLVHESGEWLGSSLSQPMPDRIQQVGSAITYLRRYALVALLGLASEEDDDGNAAEGNQVDHRQDRPPRRGKVDLGGARVAGPAGGNGQQGAPAAGGKSDDGPPRERRGGDDGLISDAQRKRMWAIAKTRGEQIGLDGKAIIDRVMVDEGVPVDDQSGKRVITRAMYDRVCKAIEGYVPGDLRQPGEEG